MAEVTDSQDEKKPLVMPCKPGTRVAVKLEHGLVREQTVQPACVGISSGQWYCTTHSIVFATNPDKEDHCRLPGTHIMAWLCKQHGIEVP